jgi:hypothetical protein
MLTKTIAIKLKQSQKLLAAYDTFKDNIAINMGKKYGEDVAPGLILFMDRVAQKLQASQEEMVQKHYQHQSERIEDPAARKNRNRVSTGIYNHLVKIRRALTTLAGPGYVHQLGFDGTISRSPIYVLRLGTRVLNSLHRLDPPEILIEGYTFNLADWEGNLKEDLQQLEKFITQISAEQVQTFSAQVDKDHAIEAFNKEFSLAKSLITALLNTAGETELAKTIRTKRRKHKKKQSPLDKTQTKPAAN